MVTRSRRILWPTAARRAYSGTVDLESDARDDMRSQQDDAHMSWETENGEFPAGEGVTDWRDVIHDEFKLGAEIGHDIQELTSDPPPVTKMIERPAEAYHDVNEWEDQDMHLGALNPRHAWIWRRLSSNGFPIGAPEDGRDGWQYEPDQEHAPTTVHDDLGEIQDEAEKKSPFVKVFRRMRRQCP